MLTFLQELSAFIGEKLDSQTQYLFHAIKKILQLYSEAPKTKIILIGHSIVIYLFRSCYRVFYITIYLQLQGGILIKALFTKPYFKSYLGHVAVVFTLATPHQSPGLNYHSALLYLLSYF